MIFLQLASYPHRLRGRIPKQQGLKPVRGGVFPFSLLLFEGAFQNNKD